MARSAPFIFLPPFGAHSGPNTASPSADDIDPGAGFLSRYLAGTRRIVTLLADQLPTLTPKSASLSHPENQSSYPSSALPSMP